MTKKEIILNTTWDEFEMGTCRLFVDVLNQYIPVVFFQDHKPTPNISNKMVQSINEILELDENELDDSMIAFVFDSTGMMGSFTMEGTKFERIRPD